MAQLNEGKLPEAIASFEKYLQLAPDGPVRGAGQGHARAAEEVDGLIQSAASDSNRQSARASAEAAARAGRSPADIRLIAVSKTFPIDAVRAAYDAGQRDFGENRVQEALAEDRCSAGPGRSAGTSSATCNRTKRERPRNTFAVIHSVDSVDLLRRIDQPRPLPAAASRAAGAGRSGARDHQARRAARPDLPGIFAAGAAAARRRASSG